MIITINGVQRDASWPADPLTRAVIISLFTWRRAESGDDTDTAAGWWGDTYPPVQNDRIGSRLYLLRREKLTNKTPEQARAYIRQALQWLVDDGVAARVDVSAERTGITTLSVSVAVSKTDGTTTAISFNDLWSELND